jgi:hypothetical protein
MKQESWRDLREPIWGADLSVVDRYGSDTPALGGPAAVENCAASCKADLRHTAEHPELLVNALRERVKKHLLELRR